MALPETETHVHAGDAAKKILVALAWPYASGPRHLATWPASPCRSDIFARYHRLKGNDVLMVSGTDEHGTPVMVSADREGVSPRELADRNNALIRDDLRRLGITYDCFTRTTTPQPPPRHAGHVPHALREGLPHRADDARRVLPRDRAARFPTATSRARARSAASREARGDQCDNCGNQLDPVDLIDPRSIIDGSTPEFRETTHLFLDLPAFAERLDEWIEAQTHWRPNVRNFSLGLVRRA